MSPGLAELRRVALGVTGLLVVVVAWGAGRVMLLSAPEPHLPAESSLHVAGVAGEDAAQALPDDLTSRPLFWYGRTPYEPPPQEAEVFEQPQEVLEMEIDEVQLVGILGAGDQSGIIVSHAGASRRLALDDEIEGWRFVGLSAEGAEFTSLGRTRVLTMEHAAPPAPAKKKSADKAAKSDKKAEKAARSESRAQRRAREAEDRARDRVRPERRKSRMTSVWGGPPQQAEPEQDGDDKPEEP